MNWQLVSVFISGLALLASGYATYKSFKYKDIERRLNKLEIEKINKEKIESKKAKLISQALNIGEGKYTLNIKNIGRSVAQNIKFKEIESKNIDILTGEIFPLKTLDIDNSIQIPIIRTFNSKKKIVFDLFWDDRYKDNNTKRFELVLPNAKQLNLNL